MNYSNVQLGFDIATSLTIVVSAVVFYRNLRLQEKRNREAGINEHTRSVVLEKIQSVLYEFEEAFTALMVKANRFESLIRVTNDLSIDTLNKFIRNKPEQGGEWIDQLKDFVTGVEEYLVRIHARKYSLVPVIDSLGNKDDFFDKIVIDIKDIERLNKDARSNAQLIIDLYGLYGALDKFRKELSVSFNYQREVARDKNWEFKQLLEDTELYLKLQNIIISEKYYFWAKRFFRESDHDYYFEIINKNGSTDDQEFKFLLEGITRFSEELLEENFFDLIVEQWVSTSLACTETRKACKKVLIKISALSHFILKKDDGVNFEDILEKYKDKHYFTDFIF